jgi:hypothetical protein
MLHALCTWTLIWLFVGIALRYFDGDVPLRVERSAVTAPGLHVTRPCDRW